MSYRFIPVVLPDYNVAFSGGKASFPLGHAGFMVVNANGEANYYEYGLYANGSMGNITHSSTGTNIRSISLSGLQFDQAGNVTNDSLKGALDTVFGSSGLYKTDTGRAVGSQYPITANEYDGVLANIEHQTDLINSNQQQYSIGHDDCMQFVYNGGAAAGLALTLTQKANGPAIPAIGGYGTLTNANNTGYQYFSPHSWHDNSIEPMTLTHEFESQSAWEDAAVQLGNSITRDLGSIASKISNSRAVNDMENGIRYIIRSEDQTKSIYSDSLTDDSLNIEASAVVNAFGYDKSTGGAGNAYGVGSLSGNTQNSDAPAYIGGTRTLTIHKSWTGALTQYSDPVTGATTSGEPIVDASGRILAQPITLSNGMQGLQHFTYDNNGNQSLSAVDLIDSATGVIRARTAYNPDGSFVINITDPSTGTVKAAQSYDSNHAYTGQTRYSPSGDVLQTDVVNADRSTTQTSYGRDARGNSVVVGSRTTSGNGVVTSTTAVHDDGTTTVTNLDPVTGAQIGQADYDANHQLTSASGTGANGAPWKETINNGQSTFAYGGKVNEGIGEVGLALGSALGNALGGNSLVGKLATATVLGTFTQSLAKAASNLGSSLLQGGITSVDAFTGALGNALSQAASGGFSGLAGQAFSEVNGHFESLLFAEAGQALGLKGFAGQAFSTVGTTITNQLELNLKDMALHPSTISVDGLMNGFNTADFVSQMGSSIGGALGSYLGSQVVKPVGIGGLLGSAGGSTAGTIAGAVLTAGADSTLGTLIGSALGTAIPIPFLGTFIGAFIGTTVGTEIGNLINGTPHAGGDVIVQNGLAVATHFQANNGGTSRPIVSVATGTAAAVNDVVTLTGGTIASTTGTGHIAYYEGGTDVTVTASNAAMAFDASNAKVASINWTKASEMGAEALLDQAQIGGGDAVMTAAFAAAKQQDGDVAAVDSDMRIAQSYQTYLANSGVINALIAQSPDSAFSAGWALTLMRAKELGLDKVDDRAGWTASLTADGSGAGTARAGRRRVSRSGRARGRRRRARRVVARSGLPRPALHPSREAPPWPTGHISWRLKAVFLKISLQ